MKTHYIKKNAAAALVCLGLGMLCFTTTSSAASKKDAPAQSNGDMAQLVLLRTPSLGSGTAATITLDGKQLVNLTQGRTYRGSVAAGQHVIAVNPHPNLGGQQPSKVEFTAEKGHTYSFKVSSKSGKVTLEKSP